MDKSSAIYWCQLVGFNKHWPNSTKSVAPESWRWVVSHYPHQDYIYKLVNANNEEIFKEDVE